MFRQNGAACFTGRCELLLELQELSGPPVILSLPAQQRPRPIDLVTGHTYQITCRDGSNSENNQLAWRQNGSLVDGSITGIRVDGSASNELTLHLEDFGGVAVGVYSCHGAPGDVASLNIGEESEWQSRKLQKP